MQRFIFPEWANTIRPYLTALAGGAGLYVVALVNFGLSPKTTDAGYAPRQPIPFSHALHVSQLGMDCRYCHNTVEVAGHAAVPSTATCLNCHDRVRKDSPVLTPLYESQASGDPVRWVKVHKLPDYVYFNHSAHVRRGIGCASCHGRVDKMEVVYQKEPLSMGWCLDCHRNPDPHLRIKGESPTQMDWEQVHDPKAISDWRKSNNINPSTDCSTCHR